MFLLRSQPKGARFASFGLGLCVFALMPTEIGYQDIASLLARQPGVAERLGLVDAAPDLGLRHPRHLQAEPDVLRVALFGAHGRLALLHRFDPRHARRVGEGRQARARVSGRPALAAAALGAGIDNLSRPLANPDEGRYSEISREMAAVSCSTARPRTAS